MSFSNCVIAYLKSRASKCNDKEVKVVFRTQALLVPITLAACVAALTATASAQTWHWDFILHQADQPPHETRSDVVLSAHYVLMTYALRVHESDVPLTSCQGLVSDIANARMVPGHDSSFLYVVFKPGRMARCNSGKQPVALLPVSHDAAAQRAIDAINHAISPPAPVRAATPAPQPKPKVVAVTVPSVGVDDWVESYGLFDFVRVRNNNAQPVTVSEVYVENCRNVIAGCGPVRRGITIGPGATSTIAAAMSRNASNAAAFTYRYQARAGTTTSNGSGTWRKRLGSPGPPMTDDEVRSAESVAIAGLADHPPIASTRANGQPDRGAQLTGRGSSRLAIGRKGSAMVRVKISAAGVPLQAQIVRISDQALTPAAIETAVTSTYSPAIQSGRPTESEYIAEFQFTGDDPALSGVPVWKRTSGPTPLATMSAAPPPRPTDSPKPAATPAPSPTPKPSAKPVPSPSPPTPAASPT
jgi:hypothetical protein